MDEARGRANEAHGAAEGDEAKKAEGRAEQRKDEGGPGGITDGLTGR